jgi:hypothetical protein
MTTLPARVRRDTIKNKRREYGRRRHRSLIVARIGGLLALGTFG